MRTFRTVLEQRIRERRQILEEFAEYAETFAREHGEPGTLGLRHLQRLASGRGTGGKPLGPVRPATARLLESIFGESIDDLLAEPSVPVPSSEVASGRSQLNAGQLPSTTGTALREHSMNTGLETACDWLDQRARWSSRAAEQQVRSQLAQSPPTDLHDWHAQRGKVGRSQLVDALSDYYGPAETRRNTYHVRCDDREIATSIPTRPDWLDLACPLAPDNDRLTFTITTSDHAAPGEFDAARAVDRLTEAAALDVRVSNEPLYRLLDVDIKPGSIDGTVSLVPFVDYALLVQDECNQVITNSERRERSCSPQQRRQHRSSAGITVPACSTGTARAQGHQHREQDTKQRPKRHHAPADQKRRKRLTYCGMDPAVWCRRGDLTPPSGEISPPWGNHTETVTDRRPGAHEEHRFRSRTLCARTSTPSAQHQKSPLWRIRCRGGILRRSRIIAGIRPEDAPRR